jgi:stage II sporulation protein AA (anti-sigma F factor antagonist)
MSVHLAEKIVHPVEFGGLNITVETIRKDGRILQTLEFDGRIDDANTDLISTNFLNDFKPSPKNYILILSHLEYVSSTGILILYSVINRILDGGGRVAIGGIHPFLRKVFDMLGLPGDIKIFDTVSRAKNSPSWQSHL